MIDPFGRTITYLRVSVTDRCDLRCVYCMAEDMNFLPKPELLTLEEMDRLCGAFIRLGTDKIRITGGEPLVRREVLTLFRGLGQRLGNGLRELTLTTNGSQLTRFADELYAAGVRRVNVSLDTLDPAVFAAVTRWGRIEKTLDGIFAAKAAGLAVKINAVALKGVNDESFDSMIAWCGEHGFDLGQGVAHIVQARHVQRHRQRLGVAGAYDVEQRAGALAADIRRAQVRARLQKTWTLEDTTYRTGGPARYYTIAETGQRIGFITPMTHNFCESCNRVRLTCTGTLYMCLGQDDAFDFRPLLRSGASDDELDAAIHQAIARKPKGHDFIIDRSDRAPAVGRHMSVTGG